VRRDATLGSSYFGFSFNALGLLPLKVNARSLCSVVHDPFAVAVWLDLSVNVQKRLSTNYAKTSLPPARHLAFRMLRFIFGQVVLSIVQIWDNGTTFIGEQTRG
jgi:hypothetical protein